MPKGQSPAQIVREQWLSHVADQEAQQQAPAADLAPGRAEMMRRAYLARLQKRQAQASQQAILEQQQQLQTRQPMTSQPIAGPGGRRVGERAQQVDMQQFGAGSELPYWPVAGPGGRHVGEEAQDIDWERFGIGGEDYSTGQGPGPRVPAPRGGLNMAAAAQARAQWYQNWLASQVEDYYDTLEPETDLGLGGYGGYGGYGGFDYEAPDPTMRFWLDLVRWNL